MTLRLPADLLAEMLAHCRDEHPREACGIMAGVGHAPNWSRRMTNVHPRSTRYFTVNPVEQRELYAGMDELGLDPVVIYHSHTASAAVPSGTDVSCAHEPDAHYVIVSTAVDPPEVRSYRLLAGQLREERLEVATCGS